MSNQERWEEGCTMPPAPGVAALIAAADSEADAATLAHLEQCPHCASIVAQIRSFQVRLLHRLYRLHCPSSDLLVDYSQGLLDPYQRAFVTHHLALCPHCSAELALLERAGASDDAFGLRGPLVLPLL